MYSKAPTQTAVKDAYRDVLAAMTLGVFEMVGLRTGGRLDVSLYLTAAAKHDLTQVCSLLQPNLAQVHTLVGSLIGTGLREEGLTAENWRNVGTAAHKETNRLCGTLARYCSHLGILQVPLDSALLTVPAVITMPRAEDAEGWRVLLQALRRFQDQPEAQGNRAAWTPFLLDCSLEIKGGTLGKHFLHFQAADLEPVLPAQGFTLDL